MDYEKKLQSLGLTLPSPPKPVATYVPTVRSGNLLFLSGMIPMVDGKMALVGKLGNELTVEQGQQYDVIGRSQDGAWVQIGTEGRELGWVSAKFVIEESVAVAPAAPAENTAETPAETPAQTETQSPAATGDFLPASMSSPSIPGRRTAISSSSDATSSASIGVRIEISMDRSS